MTLESPEASGPASVVVIRGRGVPVSVRPEMGILGLGYCLPA